MLSRGNSRDWEMIGQMKRLADQEARLKRLEALIEDTGR